MTGKTDRHRLISLTMIPFLGLTACASPIPEPIRKPGFTSPTLTEVRNEATLPKGMRVRWGGKILKVENLEKSTRLEILAYRLDHAGRPEVAGKSLGRFYALSSQFLDPKVYEKEREISLTGSVESIQRQSIGDYQYPYPVIRIDTIYLWDPRPEYSEYDWYPWGYPYYYYPYYHFYPYYHRHHHDHYGKPKR